MEVLSHYVNSLYPSYHSDLRMNHTVRENVFNKRPYLIYETTYINEETQWNYGNLLRDESRTVNDFVVFILRRREIGIYHEVTWDFDYVGYTVCVTLSVNVWCDLIQILLYFQFFFGSQNEFKFIKT